ncbi:hypothetical protein CRM22_004838 [Opisthorchis felineus]|uniref:Uncharacterized protein n=1 Tax=Opisthorchis felineus TaxID=147828 RepID=A0A4S2LU39_OPIFE|nr:hypothetical protein CRM22_004838 [Opisthorchis felineus]
MLKQQLLDEDEFQSDLESARQCAQAPCRRVADHCSSLLDALIIFKTWFIQRQGELSATNHQQHSITDGVHSSVIPFDQTNGNTLPHCSRSLAATNGPIESCSAMETANMASAVVLRERDWALSRMRRMENQVSRLRSACLAMRVQLEAGLRHKMEADQVKRELEMTLRTVGHYENIISEGNRLREDLRTELTRVRKEMSVARSRMAPNSANSCVGSRSAAIRMHDHPSDSSERADSLATSMMAALGDTQSSSTVELRTIVERQTRWIETMNTETKELRENIRALSEKDSEQTKMIDTLRTTVRDVMNRISALGYKRRKLSSSPFGSILDFRWLSSLAAHLHLEIPENLADIAVEHNPKQSAVVTTEAASYGQSAQPTTRCKRRLRPELDKSKPEPPKKTTKIEVPSPAKVDLDEYMESQSSSISDAESVPSSAFHGSKLLEDVLSELHHLESDPPLLLVPNEPSPSKKHVPDLKSVIDSPLASPTSSRTLRKRRNSRLISDSSDVQQVRAASPTVTLSSSKTHKLLLPELSTSIKRTGSPPVDGTALADRTSPLLLELSSITEPSNDEENTVATSTVESSPLPIHIPAPTQGPRTRRSNRNVSDTVPDTKRIVRKLSESSEDASITVPTRRRKLRSLKGAPLEATELASLVQHDAESLSQPLTRVVKRTPPEGEPTETSKSRVRPRRTENTAVSQAHLNSTLSPPSSTTVPDVRPFVPCGSKRPPRRSAATDVIADESIATRVLTCPAGYTRKSRSKVQISSATTKKDEIEDENTPSLLSLLQSAYSPNTIAWFDHITSETITNEASVSDPVTANQLPPMHVHDFSQSRSPPVSTGDQQQHSSDSSSHLTTDSAVKAIPQQEPVATALDLNSSLQTSCSDYLLCSASNGSPATLAQCLSNLPLTNSLDIVWLTFLDVAHHDRGKDSELREVKFVNLCLALRSQLSVRQLSDWLLSHTDHFRSPIQTAAAVKCVYRLFSVDRSAEATSYSRVYLTRLLQSLANSNVDQFLLISLPYIVDECHAIFSDLWPGLEPLRDAAASQFYHPVADPQSFSFLIATMQALLAWQEARVMRFQTVIKQNKEKQPMDIQAILTRLHTNGWLPGQPLDSGRPTGLTSLALSQQNHRLRRLALRLVDACLQLQRTEGSSSITMANTGPTPEIQEAAWSLHLLISAMAFVVGEEAIIDNEEDVQDCICELGGSTSTHQRKRRNRQTHRQLRQGLLGWLLTGRLLPWLTKQAKTLRTAATTDGQILFGRLLLVTTDLVVLGSHLFSSRNVPLVRRQPQCPTFPADELRSTIFASGRRILTLLEGQAMQPFSTSFISATVRLIGFAPQRSMNLMLRFCRDAPSPRQLPSMPTSILWPHCPLPSLLSQSLNLVSSATHLPQSIISAYTQACKLHMDSSLD